MRKSSKKALDTPKAVSGQPVQPTVEDLASRLLQRGLSEEMMSKAKMSDVLAAQRVLLEKKKVQNQENELLITAAKFFGNLMPKNDGANPKLTTPDKVH